MFKSTKEMCLIAGAVVAFFGGFSTPAWATYGGGACHRCSPPAVVASQCNAVVLAPQVQTVYQTVYETVYENEADDRDGDAVSPWPTRRKTTPS